jgi:hypothetical protein
LSHGQGYSHAASARPKAETGQSREAIAGSENQQACQAGTEGEARRGALSMPARTRGWLETSDKPGEQTFEAAPYDEVVRNTIDMAEAEKQLDHARQQLELLAKKYPGRR